MTFKMIFTHSDFDLFHIAGLEDRMCAIRSNIRPKFEKLAHPISSFLTAQISEPVFTHIAKHARRTVNPPDETWMAWSTNPRGYKAHPHFQLGINKEHIFICFALIYECTKKNQFANVVKKDLQEIYKLIPENFFISQDHTKPEFSVKKELTLQQFETIIDRLEKVKKAEFLCGVHVPHTNKQALQEQTLIECIKETYSLLLPLYSLAQDGEW